MIVEYEEKYLDDVRNLLVELEEYIISIDKDNLDTVHPEYREKMAIVDLEELEKNEGKCYLYIENGKALSLIMGCVRPYDKYDYFIGMDNGNVYDMKRILLGDKDNKVFKLLDFTPRVGEVADPYWTGDFETTYQDIKEGVEELFNYLEK